VNFLTDRHHQTKAKGSRSQFLPITASIIQGSGIGPVAYILNASDRHPVHQHNMIFKYADDTYTSCSRHFLPYHTSRIATHFWLG